MKQPLDLAIAEDVDDRILREQLAALQKRRAIAFYPALLLSVLGIFRKGALISISGGLLWCLAGALCMMEVRALAKLGLKPGATAVNAAIYFAIGALLLFRR
jgi:hypothetical protein